MYLSHRELEVVNVNDSVNASVNLCTPAQTDRSSILAVREL